MTTKSMKLEHISYLNINNSHLATKPLNVIHFKFIDPSILPGKRQVCATKEHSGM